MEHKNSLLFQGAQVNLFQFHDVYLKMIISVLRDLVTLLHRLARVFIAITNKIVFLLIFKIEIHTSLVGHHLSSLFRAKNTEREIPLSLQ